MPSDEKPTFSSDGIVAEVNNGVRSALPLLPQHLRTWLTTHLTQPRAITVAADPDATRFLQVWLVTDDVGNDDSTSRVVYNATEKAFGLLTRLENGVLWYQGPYGSLIDAVEGI